MGFVLNRYNGCNDSGCGVLSWSQRLDASILGDHSMFKVISVVMVLLWLWFAFVYCKEACNEYETWNKNTRFQKFMIILAALAIMITLVVFIAIIGVALVMAWGL